MICANSAVVLVVVVNVLFVKIWLLGIMIVNVRVNTDTFKTVPKLVVQVNDSIFIYSSNYIFIIFIECPDRCGDCDNTSSCLACKIIRENTDDCICKEGYFEDANKACRSRYYIFKQCFCNFLLFLNRMFRKMY